MAANSKAVIHTWSTHNSMRPMKDQGVLWKPDLALLDDVEARWDTIKAVCTIGKMIDNKAYLFLGHQPWRHFVLLCSLTNGYRELQVHMYDHAGGVMTPPIHIDNAPNHYLQILSSIVFGSLEYIGYDPSISIFTKMLCPTQLEDPTSHPSTNRPPAQGPQAGSPITGTATPKSNSGTDSGMETGFDEESLPIDLPQLEIPQDPLHATFLTPIGRIIVNDHVYDILKLIFSSQGLIGCSTVCYLARRNGKEYIIKDHWVLGCKDVALNKDKMMWEMQGVCGMPELVEYWLVEIAPNEVDETMNYQYKSRAGEHSSGHCQNSTDSDRGMWKSSL
ncbi:hypothetical protein BDR06DRAFT_970251 [Suillus hirtellus]|nr:hypothetical protein BDR06DRAFT_970251 [Suillus hirtellus]